MNHVGVDLHKLTSWFCVLDENGKRIDSTNVSNNPVDLKRYLSSIPRPFILAVEATYNWYFFVDLAREYAEDVLLANSYELKAFAKRHKKTDKIDSKLIAEVLWKGFLPTVTIADPPTREFRELLRYRLKLVIDRSRNIFRLKNLMDNLGLDSQGNFATYKKLDEATLSFPDCPRYRSVLLGYVDQIRFLSRKISDLEKDVSRYAGEDEDIRHLMSIPGLSFFSASLVKTEIIDIARFRSFNRLCAYAGLAPTVSQSAQRSYHGPLSHNRRKHLQWILLEVVIHFIKALPQKKERFEKIRNLKGYNTAKVVLAREMLKVVYHVLKEKRDFVLNHSFKVQSVTQAALEGV